MEHANALDLLRSRGFVQDATDADEIRELLSSPTTFYVGFDPTAPSLHIGNLMGMMAMAWLQRCGHRALAVAGGGTGRIGDPSFRDDERELLDDDQIARNLEGIRAQLSRFLDLDDPARGALLDNYDWLGRFGYLEFLREVGKHFSVNQMIARESVRRRLTEREQGISYTEFSYALLQAYDFAHLHAAEGCMLQAGGSDQWGNIVAGIDLTRRMHGAQVHGLVWPLVERSDGRKFSKSTGEAVWLDAEQTSPYAFYQWFLNVPDADAGDFLRWFTFLPLERIIELEEEMAADPAGRAAQRALAEEITRIVHGDDGVAAALAATSVLFGPEPFRGLDDRTLADAFDSAPSVDLPRADLEAGIGILSLMASVGAARSNGEARRLIEGGGVSLNNERVSDPGLTVGPDDLASATTLVLRVGKKRYYLARFS
ncbi:MAG: tyrosine--tRNA ligase [Actinobacteria bacterium]|nr:tyrosine--tRNA ligase [Actinomycetota bacterium]